MQFSMVDVDMVGLKFKSTNSADGEMGVGDGDGADMVDDEEETSTVAVS